MSYFDLEAKIKKSVVFYSVTNSVLLLCTRPMSTVGLPPWLEGFFFPQVPHTRYLILFLGRSGVIVSIYRNIIVLPPRISSYVDLSRSPLVVSHDFNTWVRTTLRSVNVSEPHQDVLRIIVVPWDLCCRLFRPRGRCTTLGRSGWDVIWLWCTEESPPGSPCGVPKVP